MVITMLAGGLGNQLFQYAFGFRIANQLQTDLKLGTHLLDSRLLARIRSYTPRNYELSPLVINQSIASTTDLAQCLLKTVLLLPKKALFLREQPHFNQDLNAINKDTQDAICLGYWQSEAYFKPVENALRRQLVFQQQPSNYTLKLINQIRALANPVFVHVRRGDYVTNVKASTYHGFSGETYYRNALSYVKTHLTDPHFFVFSDDMAWVKSQLNDVLQSATYVDGNQGNNSWQDMYLMTACRHGIVANSSFSWWGAWLNAEPNRLVIAPQQWFVADQAANERIVPARWHTL